MKIGLIDVDADSRKKITYPNLSLMKISMYHKLRGDDVQWYDGTHCDRVYVSRVFGDAYTKEDTGIIFADEVIRGGSGYAITIKDGREVYDRTKDAPLPEEIEHQYPDYSIYGLTDDAHGFLTRGCFRDCNFCHVTQMQGRISHTVARLSEFYNGQRNIHLYDPNILACKDWGMHFEDLARTRAYVDFNQGLDIRLLNDTKLKALDSMRIKRLHFAWDNYDDDLRADLERFATKSRHATKHGVYCYVLVNNGEPFYQDVERVEFLKSLGCFQPYVMVYRGDTATDEIKALKRYANNPFVCWATPTFKDYVSGTRSERFGKTGMKHKGGLKRES